VNFKKLRFISLFSLLFSILSARLVTAAQPWDAIKSIVTLEVLSKIGISNTGSSIEGFIKFLLMVTFFAIYFALSEKILKFGKNISVVIALTFSFLSTILIPGKLLITFATTYTTIASVIILGIPILSGFWAYFKMKEHPFIRIGILILLIYVLHLIINFLESGPLGLLDTVFKFGSGLVTAVLVVMYVLLGFSLLKIFNAGEHLPGAIPGFVKNFLSRDEDKSSTPKEEAKEQARKKKKKPKEKGLEKEVKYLTATTAFLIETIRQSKKLQKIINDRSPDELKESEKILEKIQKYLHKAYRQLHRTINKVSGTDSKTIQLLTSDVQAIKKWVDGYEVTRKWPDKFNPQVGNIIKRISDLIKSSNLKIDQNELREMRAEIKAKEQTRNERGPPKTPYGGS